MKVYILAIVATLVALCLAAVYEVFYVRRKKLHKQIASMVGEHLQQGRLDAQGTTMPHYLLDRAMNQKVDKTDEAEAKQSMETMLGVAIEAKRRNFLLPLAHQNTILDILNWAARQGPASEVATKLLPYVRERQLQHVDQFIATSKSRISEEDPQLAANTMRTISSMYQATIAAGMKIDPAIVFFSPNKEIVNQWASNDEHPATKKQALTLLETVAEALVLYNAPENK